MKKKFYFSLLLTAATFASCSKKDDPAPTPTACFSANREQTADPLYNFSFSDCSGNAMRYEWDFGDGNSSTSASPAHVYNQWGVFTVRLTVFNADGVTSTATKTITIGHYTVTKIIFNAVAEPLPMRFQLTNYNSLTLANVTVNSPMDLPDTITFTDSPIYDSDHDNNMFYYQEEDGAGNLQWGSSGDVSFATLDSSPEHKQDFGMSNGSNNALFTMYFNFVVR